MPGRRNPKRWLIKRLGNGPATGYDLSVNSQRPDDILPALWSLTASGHITKDPHDHHYRLTTKGNETLMRITRRKKDDAADVANLAVARDRLAREFWGEQGPAEAAVQDDPVLSERLAVALHDGMVAPDLGEVSMHRRPALVEEAIAEFRRACTGGPCHYCGTRVARRSCAPVSALDPETTPGFTTAHERPACAWCAYMLGGTGHIIDELREMAGNAVAGTIGINVAHEYRYAHMVKFAHEVGYSGTPWGHLADDKTVWVIRARAFQVVHKTRFVTRPEQVRLVAIPGIETTVWPKEALPGGEKKVFAPLADLVAAAEEAQALRERRAAAEAQKATRYDGWNRKRARIEAERTQAEETFRDRAKRLGVL